MAKKPTDMDEVLDALGGPIDMLRDFQCCDSTSKFCGWRESINEMVAVYDAAIRASKNRRGK